MNKLSIFVDNIGASQLSYTLITLFNKFLEHEDLDIMLFYVDIHKHCMTPNFSVMEIIEAWDQKGAGIATSFSTVEKLLLCPRINPKILYLWDLDFLRFFPKIYSVARNILCNKDIEIICRSKSHAKLIENNFNRKVKYVVDNFNLDCLFTSLKSIDKSQDWTPFVKIEQEHPLK